MSPQEQADIARRVLELESGAKDHRADAAALAHAVGIPDLIDAAKKAEADADQLRGQLVEYYAGEHAQWLAYLSAGVETPLPETPPGVSYCQREKLEATDPALVPREACAPVKSLLRSGMPGVDTVRSWSVTISEKKLGKV